MNFSLEFTKQSDDNVIDGLKKSSTLCDDESLDPGIVVEKTYNNFTQYCNKPYTKWQLREDLSNEGRGLNPLREDLGNVNWFQPYNNNLSPDE